MITVPHTLLTTVITLELLLPLKILLKREITKIKPVNHKNEAEIMPDINGRAWLESKVTWKAPNIIVPSMAY